MTKILKCFVGDNNSLTLCAGWSGTVGRTNDGSGGGFEIVDLWDNKTLKPVGRKIVAHSGEKAKNGVYINYCPWCGGSLMKERTLAVVDAA